MLANNLQFSPSQVLDRVQESSFVGVRGAKGGSELLVARREFYDVGHDTGRHRHLDFWALYVARGGRGVHEMDAHPFGVARGDVYLMPPLCVHRYFDYQQLQIDAFYFQSEVFAPEEWEVLRAQSGFWRLFVAPTPEGAPQAQRFRLEPEVMRATEAATDLLRAECARRDDLAPLLWRHQFFALLAGLARAQNVAATPASTCSAVSARERVHENGLANVLRFCRMNFHRPVTVPQMAAQMFLSSGRFSQVFAREMGTSPAAYLRSLRLERAQQLLRESDWSIGRIAIECGFADGAQLCRAFGRDLGVSPRAYRRSFGRQNFEK